MGVYNFKYTEEEANLIIDFENKYPYIAQGYMEITKEQYLLFAQKHMEYGLEAIDAGTKLENDTELNFALTGLWYRINDNFSKWKNLLLKRRKDDESSDESFQDISNYSIVAQLLKRKFWKE